MPDADTPASISGANPTPSGTGTRGTILIAEDTSNIRLILVHLLEEAGYQTVQARDGAEAIALATMQKFDLMLVDIMMPKMDGYAVCVDLRSREGTRELPIIMVTARGSRDAVIQAIRSGANDYIVKPFTKEILLNKIDKAIRKS